MDATQRWTETANKAAPERSLTPPDQNYWSDAELDALDKEAHAAAQESVRNSDWWDNELQGICETSKALPIAMAECRRNFDAACNGDQGARDLILRALREVFKVADRTAYDDEHEKLMDGRGE